MITGEAAAVGGVEYGEPPECCLEGGMVIAWFRVVAGLPS